MKLFTVSDDQMNGYCGPVFEAESDQAALISIRNAASAPGSYALRAAIRTSKLICVGDFDRVTGVMTPDHKIVSDLSTLSLLEVGDGKCENS